MKQYRVSFWTFVAGIFLIYGIILMITGAYYWISGTETSAANFHHPTLWWGAVMFVAGLIFYQISRKS
ncbi:MAG: hypothetical protein K0U29_01755 [Gammaproteobacteria bacterium]|nr:hypothetical protein [Gammaproteobacteria bacterium]